MNLDALNLEVLRPVLPLPFMAKMGVLAATVVVIGAIYFFTFFTPLMDEVTLADKEIATKEADIEAKKIKITRLPQARLELKKLAKDLKVALALLPPKAQIAELLTSISGAARDAGLIDIAFKPRPETRRTIYAEIPVDLQLKGTFYQLLSFLRSVGEMSRIVAIKNLKISSSSKSSELRITGLLITYRFIEQGKKVP